MYFQNVFLQSIQINIEMVIRNIYQIAFILFEYYNRYSETSNRQNALNPASSQTNNLVWLIKYAGYFWAFIMKIEPDYKTISEKITWCFP